MRRYEYIPQEKPDYCIPACLQMVLKSREIKCDSQKQIMEGCGKHINIKCTIDSYFKKKRIPLSCSDFMANESFSRDFDIFVADALRKECDILVGYAYEILRNTPNKANHVSLLTQSGEGEIVLIDPDSKNKSVEEWVVRTNLNKLVESLYASGDGFHCIHPSEEVLRSLNWL